jgi:hypothetical protein
MDIANTRIVSLTQTVVFTAPDLIVKKAEYLKRSQIRITKQSKSFKLGITFN